MHTVLIVIHVLLAISLIGMVLVQRGAGATAGAAFGSGASSTVFGSRGAGSFLTRTTAVLATGFFLISLGMAVLVSRGGLDQATEDLGVMSGVRQQQQQEGDAPPATDVPPSGEAGGATDAPVDRGTAGESGDVPAMGAPQEEEGGN